jgi:phosphoglycerate dehydrogenase-like enzyme
MRPEEVDGCDAVRRLRRYKEARVMTRVAILDDYQDVALAVADWRSLGREVTVEAFHERLGGEDALVKRLGDFEVIVAMRERTQLPRSVLERLPKLKLLVTTGMRNVAIDAKAAADLGIVVSGTALLTPPTAELTWGMILALARHIPEEAQHMRRGGWQTTVGVGLNGKVLGVLGLGKLGGEVARVGRAFQMEVIAWSQNLTAEHASSLGARRVEKDELFQRADFVTIHLILSKRTRGLVAARELALMKPGAYLINTSRGPIVDESALIEVLKRRTIAGAALDVFDEEPLADEHPLRKLDNVVLTPHLGYVTVENYRIAYGEAVEDIRAFLAGHPIRTISA